MIDNQTVYCLILARGGSKGIPHKCIADLNGKPLISYSIEPALKSKYIDRVVVSTDDDKIADVSKQYNAEVPFMRPPEFATDEASSVSVIIHALDYFKKVESKFPNILVVLQPTSPLRITDDIDKSIEIYAKSEANTLVSVTKPEISPYWFKKLDDNRYLTNFISPPEEYYRRQDSDNLYILNGAVYIYDSEKFLLNKINKDSPVVSYVMPIERSVDIDTPLDLEFVEFLLKREKVD